VPKWKLFFAFPQCCPQPAARISPNELNGPITLQQVQELFSIDDHCPVLLPIPAKEKGPHFNKWQKTTYAETQEQQYQQRLLEHPNTGILLGAPSEDLCAFDWDTEEGLAAFLELNPRLQDSLRTRGERGAQVWAYITGERQRQIHPLKVAPSSPLAAGEKPGKDGKVTIGEFRAEGGQSVIRGIHPNGSYYSWLCINPPMTIRFDEIIWPADIIIPWEKQKQHREVKNPADKSLLKRAIEVLTIDRLWNHFGFPERQKNPVHSPFHPEDKETSFSIYNEGRRFKDHDPDYDHHRGDSFDFYCLATKRDAKSAFTDFIALAGLGNELSRETPEWNNRKIHEGREKAQQASREETEEEKKQFEELLTKYEACVHAFEAFKELDIQPRKLLLGRWMKEGDTGFIFGERGAGKTWLVDALVASLSTGNALFDWEVPERVNVLILDGEMPYDEAKARLSGLQPDGKGLYLLHHEVLFRDSGLVMNLGDPVVQRIVTNLCEKKAIKVLILDNLSCLVSGVDENTAIEWEKLLPWLLDMRRRRIAVIIVHHAGRSGFMRGTSKREDHAFWVIRVDEVKGQPISEEGAHFEIIFTKQRNSSAKEWNIKAHFQTENNGLVSVGFEALSFEGKVLELIQNGLGSASEIAEELAVAKSTVSKVAKRLIEQKVIELRARKYVVRGVLNE
jgi:hypothetical protein